MEKYLWLLKCELHANSKYLKDEEYGFSTIGPVTYQVLSSKGWDFLNSHFYEITELYGYKCSKEWFKKYLLDKPSYYNSPHKKRKLGRWGLYWSRRWDARGKQAAYKRNPKHKKKTLSEKEINKREWREKKGVSKDKSKAYYRRGAGKWYKKYSNTLHRQWEKEMIHSQKWDEMSDKDYKLFLDPWLWD